MRVLRIGDPVICVCGCKWCPICPPGVVLTGSPNTIIEGKPVSTVSDRCSNCCFCCCRCPNPIVTGSSRTFVNGKPVALETSVVICGVPIATNVLTHIGA